MIMRICPSCLIGVDRENPFCHQCGQNIAKRPASKKTRKMPWNEIFRFMFDLAILFALLAIGYISVS